MSWVTLPLVYAITFFGTPFGGGGPSVEHERSLPLMRVGIPTVSMLSTRHALERLPKWVRVKWPGPKASESGGQKRTWVGHWRVERSEDDKAEAVLKAEGVPYVARQIAMRFKPERRVRMRAIPHTRVSRPPTQVAFPAVLRVRQRRADR